MKIKTVALFLWAGLIATAAVAGDKHETHIEIVTDDGGAFEWRSSDPGADFSDLEVGESKTVAGDDGKELTVTRTAEGLEFEVDGEKIQLMEFSGEGDIDMDVEKTKKVRVIKTDDTADVTIISADEIDDETRAKLEQVLKDAGKDGEILVLDGSELDADAQAHHEHEVRIIKKKVEKTD